MSVNDNTLKKEFSTRDVNRARNLITKKFGDATGIQAGYTKQVVEHSEGEIWEENGKKCWQKEKSCSPYRRRRVIRKGVWGKAGYKYQDRHDNDYAPEYGRAIAIL